MKSIVLPLFLLVLAGKSQAQQVDSICFHLYTDSLKKGTYNYINVDGKLSNGRWLPMTAKEITFSSSDGRFEGNSLFLERDFAKEFVTVKAVLKENPSMTKEVTIYIKKKEDNELLKTTDEILQGSQNRGKGKRRNLIAGRQQ